MYKQPFNIQYNSFSGVTGYFLIWILHPRTAVWLDWKKIHDTAININWHFIIDIWKILQFVTGQKIILSKMLSKNFKLQNNHVVWNVEVGWYIFEGNYILYFIAIIKTLEDTPNNLLHFKNYFLINSWHTFNGNCHKHNLQILFTLWDVILVFLKSS